MERQGPRRIRGSGCGTLAAPNAHTSLPPTDELCGFHSLIIGSDLQHYGWASDCNLAPLVPVDQPAEDLVGLPPRSVHLVPDELGVVLRCEADEEPGVNRDVGVLPLAC